MVGIQVINAILPFLRGFLYNQPHKAKANSDHFECRCPNCVSWVRPTDSFVEPPTRRSQSMSIVVWTLLRRLPKPALLVLTLFLLAAMARS
jgi:hypothetical protein